MSEQQEQKDFEMKMLDVLAMFSQGYTLADFAGLKSEHLEALYALGYQLYNAQNYEDALKVFEALRLYDHTQTRFHMGAGACLQALERYQQAVEVYSVAALSTGLADPAPIYYGAVCLLKSGKKEEAMGALESLVIMGRKGNAKDDKIKQKGANLLALLKEAK